MATDSKLKMRLALEPREVAAVIVACNEMLQMAQFGRTIRGTSNIEDGRTNLERASPRLVSADIHERAA